MNIFKRLKLARYAIWKKIMMITLLVVDLIKLFEYGIRLIKQLKIFINFMIAKMRNKWN